MAAIRVLIVEDHVLVREGLKLLISREPALTVTGDTGDGGDVETMARELQPDLILLDLDLPGNHGAEIAARVKREFPHIKIIILTGSLKQENIRQALAAGADGYVIKHSNSEELKHAIKTVLAGDCFVSPQVAALSDNGPAPETQLKTLTARELDIVAYLARGKTSHDIAATLCLSVHTVRTHRKNILDKLDLRNAAELTAWAIKSAIISH